MEKKKILVTGISGLLGNNISIYFSKKNDVTGIYHQHPVAIPQVRCIGTNMCDYAEIRNVVCDIDPDIVIHCASRTDVDGMERDREAGWQANVLTTRVLLDVLRDLDTKIVHISTDSVYAGHKGPYVEEMGTMPCNWYGKTKLESEKLVYSRENALILRTNLYGWNIRNKQSLAEWFLDHLQKGQKINGFSDVKFSSIYTFSLAAIIEKCLIKNLHGIYNCACRDSWTKFQFGVKLAELFKLDSDLITAVSIDQSDLQARRGKDLSLDVSRLEKAIGHQLPTMAESLKHFFNDWQKHIPNQIKQGNYRKSEYHFYPQREGINYGGQAIDQADIDAVVKVLKSSNLTQGKEVCRFEEEIASYLDTPYAVAVNSGTAALHLACLSCGLKSDDEGITSPITFLASANAIVYCGARPCFADIDPLTYNMSPDELEKKITSKTHVIIPVHFAGQSCDMRKIQEIVLEKERLYGHKIFIIEDASHALGSLYLNRKVGCCEYSDAAVLSFHPVKHITTGEGGMVITNNIEIAKTIRNLRSHGISKEPDSFYNRQLAFSNHSSVNQWYYEQHNLGFNYRITDFQCALGRSQLNKINWFLSRRRMIVETYNREFKKVPSLKIPFEAQNCCSNFHLYVIQINFEDLCLSRHDFMEELKDIGIQTQVHYIPVHLQPYYKRRFGTASGDCPEAENYYSHALSLPLYPSMDESQVKKVITSILQLVKKR